MLRLVASVLSVSLLTSIACSGGSGSSTGSGGSSTGGSSTGGSSTGGSSTGGSSTGGSSTGGSSTGGSSTGGSSTGGSSTGGSSSGGSGGASDGGTCSPTPGTVQCGDGVCDLSSEYCCGGIELGKCFAIGAFCGLGGMVEQYCDDSADCASGEICCMQENDGTTSDAQWKMECQDPAPPGPNEIYGCGTTPGNLPWPALCSCTNECQVGSCTPGSVIYLQGTYSVCQ